MAGTLTLRTPSRDVYPCSALTIAGLPLEMVSGDVADDAIITITATVTEGTDDTLRLYLQDSRGFWGSIRHGEYVIGWRDGRLSQPLPERDYGHRSLTFQIQTRRDMLTELVRPLGRQPVDYEAQRRAVAYAWSLDADVLRRRRLELDSAYTALEQHRVELAAAEAELAERRKQLDTAAAA